MPRRPLPPEPGTPGFDMTPMIDIVFQLIIFFMLVMDFAQRRYDPLELPRATQAKVTKEPDVVVNVLADGRVRVGGRTFDDGALEALFESLRPGQKGIGTPLTLRADRSARFEQVQKVMMIASAHGNVTRVQFATRKE